MNLASVEINPEDRPDAIDIGYPMPSPNQSLIHHLQDSVRSLESLNNNQCISNYAERFLTGRRHLLAFTDTPDCKTCDSKLPHGTFRENDQAAVYENSSLLVYEVVEPNAWTQQSYGEDPLYWMCSSLPEKSIPDGTLRCSASRINASNWSIFDHRIKYCRSEKVEEHCELQFNRLIGLVVVTCNVAKFCCMVIAAFMLKQNTLCTLG